MERRKMEVYIGSPVEGVKVAVLNIIDNLDGDTHGVQIAYPVDNKPIYFRLLDFVFHPSEELESIIEKGIPGVYHEGISFPKQHYPNRRMGPGYC